MRIVAGIIITAISVVNSSLQVDDNGPKLQFKETIPGDERSIEIDRMEGTKSVFSLWTMPLGPSTDFKLVEEDLIKFQNFILDFQNFLNLTQFNDLKRTFVTRAGLKRDEVRDEELAYLQWNHIPCEAYVGNLYFETDTIQDPKRVCAYFQFIKESATHTMGPRLVMSVADRDLTVSFNSGTEMKPSQVSDLLSWVLPVPQKYDIKAVQSIIENNIRRLIKISDYFRGDSEVQKKGLMFESITVTQSTGGAIIECGEEVGTVTLTESQIEISDEKNYCGYLLSFKQEIFDKLAGIGVSNLT